MNLRSEMPVTAAWIDALRDAFGADGINAQIRRGMRGEPVFYAKEGGREIGRRDPREGIRPSIVRAVVIGKAKR